MKEIFKDSKFKNPYFWLSVVALIFSASGVDFNQLTSWRLLGEALLGIWNDNSTKGLDKPKMKKE